MPKPMPMTPILRRCLVQTAPALQISKVSQMRLPRGNGALKAGVLGELGGRTLRCLARVGGWSDGTTGGKGGPYFC